MIYVILRHWFHELGLSQQCSLGNWGDSASFSAALQANGAANMMFQVETCWHVMLQWLSRLRSNPF